MFRAHSVHGIDSIPHSQKLTTPKGLQALYLHSRDGRRVSLPRRTQGVSAVGLWAPAVVLPMAFPLPARRTQWSSAHQAVDAVVEESSVMERTSESSSAAAMPAMTPQEAEQCASATSCGETVSQTHTASVSRALVVLRPALRRLSVPTGRPVNGPTSVILIVMSLVFYAWAAIRSSIAKRVKACKCCKGFGIVRCDLCMGAGVMGWEGKYSHQNHPCPRCMGNRYINCNDCGGMYHRPMFKHSHVNLYDLVASDNGAQDESVDEEASGKFRPNWAV